MTSFVATNIMPFMIQIRLFCLDLLGEDVSDFFEDVLETIKKFLADLLGVDYFLKKALGDEALNPIKNILFLGTKSGDTYTSFWSAVNSILTIVKPVGYAAITTFFIIYIFDLASKDQITFDMLVKISIQLIVVVALAGNLNVIINAFLSISDSLLNKISNTSGLGGSSKSTSWLTDKEIKSMVDSMVKDTGVLAAWVQAVILWLLHQVSVIGVYFAAFQRALDVGWRISLAPIGIANSFEGGANSAGVRYLKSLLASILSGVLVYIVVALGYKITGGLVKSDAAGNMWAAMACMLATAGAAIAISAKSKELIS